MSNENLIAHKYFRYNGASFITDPIAIKNLKISQERSIIDNQKLGEYDLEGNYYISTEITKELLLLTKTISEFRANDPLKGGRDVYRLHANLPGFEKIEFLLEVDAKTATLFLLEKNFLEGGQYIETDEVFIKQFSSETELSFAEIKKLIKIDEGDNNSGRNISPEEYSHIYLRKIYLNQVANTLSEITIKTERDSFEQAIEILKKSGSYGVKVLKVFVERLNDRKDVVDNKDYMGYNKALNDILFSAIEMATSEEDLKDSKISKVHNNIIAIRNAPIKNAIEEAKGSVTPLSVKGKLFEMTKTDLPKEVVESHYTELSTLKMVNKEVNKAKSDEIKLIRERDLVKPEETISDKKVEKTVIKGAKANKNTVIEAEKPAYVFKNVEKPLTPENISDKLNVIQTGNRVVEEKPDKPVKVTKEKLDNSEKLNTFDEGKPKAKAEKASKLNKAEKDAETFAENSEKPTEKVTKTAEPIIQSTNKEEKIQRIIDNAEKRKDLSDEEKAVIANEYLQSTNRVQSMASSSVIENQKPESRYIKISDEEIAPAMDKAVTEYEKTEAAIKTIFAEPKPAEPAKTEKQTLKEEQKKEEKEQTNLGFNIVELATESYSDKQEFAEMVQEKIK